MPTTLDGEEAIIKKIKSWVGDWTVGPRGKRQEGNEEEQDEKRIVKKIKKGSSPFGDCDVMNFKTFLFLVINNWLYLVHVGVPNWESQH